MGTARRKFTKQYKADAVQLYQDSGLTMGQVAQQLGIGESTLQSWVKNVKDEGDVAAGETPLTQAEKKRIRDLEAELRRVNMENAFLKKAYQLRVETGGLAVLVPQLPVLPRRTSRASACRPPGQPGP